MVIYLDEHRATKCAPVGMSKTGTYADEVMHTNCNPAVIYMFNRVARTAPSAERTDDLARVDVDAFLGRVYALATQI